MARQDDRDSATSQFFINLDDNDRLNRSVRGFGYTVFGRVVEGMDVVDSIAGVQTSKRGMMDDVPISAGLPRPRLPSERVAPQPQPLLLRYSGRRHA